MRNKTWKAKRIEEMVDKFCSIFEYALISLLMKNKIFKNMVVQIIQFLLNFGIE